MKKSPGSDIRYLKKVIAITKEMAGAIPAERFISPYSLIPLVSQVVGLNAPLLGTGASRYSLFNVILELSAKKSLLREAFEIPFTEKRIIVDELYDAVAPCLLGEEGEYTELLLDTRFNRRDRRAVEEKIGRIKEFFLPFRGKSGSGDFAHVAHYGYLDDLGRECLFIKKMPGPKAEEWYRRSYPVVNELVFRHEGREYKGWIIFVANSTEQLLRDGKLRKRKIVQAARLADALGARRAAMAGLIASFAGGGREVADAVPRVGFTTGHAYTIGNIIRIAEQVSSRVGLDLRKARIAVVGAAGSIGSGCAKLLAAKGVQKMLLIETSSFASRKKLEELRGVLVEKHGSPEPDLSLELRDIGTADLIIVATNSPTALIPARFLKKGAIIIDDSFPKNVSARTFNARKDIILLEGGAVSMPLDMEIDAARNMPDLMDAPLTRLISCKEIYGCFAEVLSLAMTGHEGNYGLGQADPALAADIMARADRIGFRPAPLQCFDQLISEERYETVRSIMKKRGLSL